MAKTTVRLEKFKKNESSESMAKNELKIIKKSLRYVSSIHYHTRKVMIKSYIIIALFQIFRLLWSLLFNLMNSLFFFHYVLEVLVMYNTGWKSDRIQSHKGSSGLITWNHTVENGMIIMKIFSWNNNNTKIII